MGDQNQYDVLADGDQGPAERDGIQASSPGEAAEIAQQELDDMGATGEEVVAVRDESTGEITSLE